MHSLLDDSNFGGNMADSRNNNEHGKENGKLDLGRRGFFTALGAGAGGLASLRYIISNPHLVEAAGKPDKIVTIVEFNDQGVRTGEMMYPVLHKSDAEWRKQLSQLSFEVTRHADTEQPFTGSLLNVHDRGVFRCICCDTAAYNSATKFESGTGWPSFWAPIAKENIIEATDASLGMVRTAVSCRRCEAHLGHVFDDGPRPTGLRYCMNSVSLRFAKA
jgi:peptide-methionine (R)-S-oxide reductase